MSQRDRYPAGAPCWIDTLQPDPQAALDFYGPLFGWQFSGPGPMPGDPPGQYFVARRNGRDVAGIASLPDRPGPAAPPPSWNTYIRVDSADDAAERVNSAGGSVLDGPFDVLPAGRMAVVADPAGAVFCLWEAAEREGAQLVNEPGAWAMSALNTSDPDAARAFYGELFGWQAEPFGPAGSPTVLWRLPGYVGGEPHQPVPRDVVGVMLPVRADGSGRPGMPHWSVDLWVDNADATAARAGSLGGKIVVPPFDIPGFRSVVLADPSGAVLSVSKLTVGG